MPTTTDPLARAAQRPRWAARAITPLVVAGLTLSACTDDGGDNAHFDHASAHDPAMASTATGSGQVTDGATSTSPPAGDAQGHDDHAHRSEEDPHAHHGSDVDEVVPTTGPPRPAATDIECGTTVLPDAEQIMRYCGTGHASLSVGKDTAEVEGAQCEDRGMFFLAHFGTNYSDEGAARGEYLGLVLEEVPDSGVGSPRISALELTFQGHRQVISEAEVDVEISESAMQLTLTGSLHDGSELRVEGHCEVS